MRGRRPATTAEKLAKGETRPSRVNYDEPDVPEANVTAAPKDLRGAGFRLWRDHAEAMKDSGQLRATDVPLFIAHCKTAMDLEYWEKEKSKRDLDRAARQPMGRAAGGDFQRPVADGYGGDRSIENAGEQAPWHSASRAAPAGSPRASDGAADDLPRPGDPEPELHRSQAPAPAAGGRR